MPYSLPTRAGALLARAFVLALLAAPALPAQSDLPREGRWTLDLCGERRECEREGEAYLQLTIDRGGRRNGGWNWNSGQRIALDRLRGITGAQMRSDSGVPVRFELPRDAGTLRFEGYMRRGLGSGHFTWAVNPALASELQRRGLERADESEAFELTVHDVGFAFLDELTRQQYTRPTLDELVQLGRHGVSLDYVRALDRLGYRVGDVGTLRQLRDHGVTPAFIEGMR